MDNSEIWKEIRRLKQQVKRTRSSTSDSSSEKSISTPRCKKSTPRRDKFPPRKRTRRRVYLSDSSDISHKSQEIHQESRDDQIDILSVLGDDPTVSHEFSEDIHSHMAVRWNNILQKGIKRDNRSDLIKKYLPPSNCKFLKPPKLNDEIKVAVQESAVKRDNKLEIKQNQLCARITCIGRALDLVLKVTDKELRDQIIKNLSDGGQILTDLHFLESITRRSLLVQGLNKVTKDVIKDRLLFGEGLTEKLKAMKACSVTAANIKSKAPRPSTSNTRQDSRNYENMGSAGSLNWRGSSRRVATSSMTPVPYRERRPASNPSSSALPRRAQTSQRPPQTRRM